MATSETARATFAMVAGFIRFQIMVRMDPPCSALLK
jgi:hypothetical protein